MSKVHLTPEEKAKLIEAINNGTEPTADLLPKLFPGTAEKFDVQALDRAKVPALEYAGKRSKAAILAEAGAGIGAAPLQTVRCFGETKKNEWCNLIVQGDNLQFLKTCYNNTDPLIKNKIKGKVKLIYIDPPFATKSDFIGKDGEFSYSDKVGRGEFLEALRERLFFMREMLTEDGSIFVHLDQKMAHYAKVILDEVFGKEHFRNEIIWCYHGPGSPGMRQFNRKHDSIFWYCKSINWVFNKDAARIPHDAKTEQNFKQGLKGSGFIAEEYDIPKGKIAEDYWNMAIAARYPANGVKRMGYPTEKPFPLLERIISVCSNEGDLIVDYFGGSGVTAAVGAQLNRRWISCDFGKHSIYTMQKRLLRIGESKALIDEKDKSGKIVVKKGDLYKKDTKPFCIVSSGAYDFSHIMDLRKHKDAYVDFVLGLFHLARNEEKASKYKLANIYAVTDNNPVEVYPVWDDEFLKEVKIDESYLQGIINQSGGKLKGEYYIITPESCTNISDTIFKNQDGKDVQFLIKTFPYKVLEDISRNLELQEQPSSQDNVNNLITSTAFYFNEDVKFAAVRTTEGFKITKFESKILDKEGNRFEGFSGLAMLLVDLDYEPDKPFDMDKTVFAKEINEDGSIKITSLTKSVGLIAIDKHGNESKTFNLE
jgi:DNA modification methylase